MRCGFSDVRALQFDHINGGGNQDLRIRGTSSMYAFYIKNPEITKSTLQVLCANCNWIKRWEKNEHCRSIVNGLKGGRPEKLLDKGLVLSMLQQDIPKVRVAREVGICKTTLYKELRRLNLSQYYRSTRAVVQQGSI